MNYNVSHHAVFSVLLLLPVSSRATYCPQHPVLKHPQSVCSSLTMRDKFHTHMNQL
jgi:hypothetical protein